MVRTCDGIFLSLSLSLVIHTHTRTHTVSLIEKKERVTPVNIVNMSRGRPKGSPRKSVAPFQPRQVVHTEWGLCVLVDEAVDEDTGAVGWNCQFDEGQKLWFLESHEFRAEAQ